MFVYISVLLILIKLGHIYFSGELANNIDDFVLVYNTLKKNSLIFLIYLNNKIFDYKHMHNRIINNNQISGVKEFNNNFSRKNRRKRNKKLVRKRMGK